MTRSYYAGRTARALELAARGPVTATALAADLRIDPRTARRLLTRLAADGMVAAVDGRPRRYVPGPRLLALAARLSAHGPGRPRTA
ncbi:MAG TPA: helix-turn-helix domain-containing protein [Solirubrobacteraceae bacterium]|nr:helix-turn-helix domain-containing protein [Solirubrobacteraceae bacterium]